MGVHCDARAYNSHRDTVAVGKRHISTPRISTQRAASGEQLSGEPTLVQHSVGALNSCQRLNNATRSRQQYARGKTKVRPLVSTINIPPRAHARAEGAGRRAGGRASSRARRLRSASGRRPTRTTRWRRRPSRGRSAAPLARGLSTPRRPRACRDTPRARRARCLISETPAGGGASTWAFSLTNRHFFVFLSLSSVEPNLRV